MSNSATFESEVNWRWLDLTSFLSPAVSSKWWNALVTAYTEPHRYYHTLKHLCQMFDHYDRNKHHLANQRAFAFAILFHEFCYNPQLKSKEKSSVEVFQEFCAESSLDEVMPDTVHLIEATNGLTDAHMDSSLTGKDDIHYFLDFDMAILGTSESGYDEYKDQIRKEYSHLDDAEYKQERCKVLKMFLQIPNIFATAEFRNQFELKARANIQREIDSLAAV